MKIRAIRASIYKHDSYVKCSNNGISEHFDEVYVICPDGHIELDADNIPANTVVIKERRYAGRSYRYAEPVHAVPSGCVGWMAGGSLVYSCDSRFGGMPLCLHDRKEGNEEYNRYFD